MKYHEVRDTPTDCTYHVNIQNKDECRRHDSNAESQADKLPLSITDYLQVKMSPP